MSAIQTGFIQGKLAGMKVVSTFTTTALKQGVLCILCHSNHIFHLLKHCFAMHFCILYYKFPAALSYLFVLRLYCVAVYECALLIPLILYADYIPYIYIYWYYLCALPRLFYLYLQVKQFVSFQYSGNQTISNCLPANHKQNLLHVYLYFEPWQNPLTHHVCHFYIIDLTFLDMMVTIAYTYTLLP